ncbi:MAG: outer membrane protein assembly factor BamC [Betaproteobacteria bacterium]|nr:outer membrane protein assembly factor BamC [Betaproteobacteria bacterium]
MSIQRRWAAGLGLGAVTLGLLAGCTMPTHIFDSKRVDYKTQADSSQPLDVPPDLTPIQTDDRYAIPGGDKGQGTTYSQYAKDRESQPAAAAPTATSGVLPQLANGVSLQRDGAERWLVVKATPEQLWPVLKQFWTSNGFTLSMEDPKIGVMETDWSENRSAVPQDFFKRMISSVVNNIFSSPLRDKYRTRLERGSEPGTTEIYITHKGMEEVMDTGQGYNGSSWQQMPRNIELEDEYLKKLALKLGTPEEQANALVAGDKKPAAILENKVAKIVHEKDDTLISINEPFDRAWRRVGLALDRSGFTVEDRDRAAGVYYVRFTDSDLSKKYRQKESFWSNLMFWKSEDKSKDTQTYRVTVTNISGRGTTVDVRDKAENRVNPETTQRILELIYEQL